MVKELDQIFVQFFLARIIIEIDWLAFGGSFNLGWNDNSWFIFSNKTCPINSKNHLFIVRDMGVRYMKSNKSIHTLYTLVQCQERLRVDHYHE